MTTAKTETKMAAPRRTNETAAKVVSSALCQFTVDAQLPAIFPHNNAHAARRILMALEAAGYKVSRR